MGAISYIVQLDPVVVGVPGLVVLQFQVVQLQVEQFAGIAHVRHCVRVCVWASAILFGYGYGKWIAAGPLLNWALLSRGGGSALAIYFSLWL